MGRIDCWMFLINKYRLVLLGALFSFLSINLCAQVGIPYVPETNPARPTVSTPATLTPSGYLQFENGGLFATHSPEFSKHLALSK
jgi:hypothetical protein